MTTTAAQSRILPPWPAVRVSLGVLGGLAVLLPLAWWTGGDDAILPFALGLVGTVAAAVGASWRTAVATLAAATLVAALAAALGSDPVVGALLTAAAALAAAPLATRTAGAGVMLPVVAAILATLTPTAPVWTVAMWVLIGGAATTLLVAVLGLRVAAPAAETASAWRHATVTAVLAGAATGVTLAAGLPHGYWVVATMCVVLRPVRDETRRAAADRVAGTLAGAVVATAAALVLPRPATAALAAVGLVLMLAWTAAGKQRLAAMYATPAVILLAAPGVSPVDLALERVLLSVAGALLAAVGAWLLAAYERRGPGPTEPRPDASRP